MVFHYKAVDENGNDKEGAIEALNKDLAIRALQRRNLVVTSIVSEEKDKPLLKRVLWTHVPMKDIVILSRQIATLFEAQVSAVQAFKLLAQGTKNETLRSTLNRVVEDIQAGASIGTALEKHPDIFSEFYVNMVHAGEEAGTLNETFNYLAAYLDRQYELTTKTRNALIYPAFVVFTFIVVMVLMLVMVIPKLSQIIVESGQEIPIYTKIVIGISDFFVNYGFFVLLAVIVAGVWLWLMSRSKSGQLQLDGAKLAVPIIGPLFTKLYLSRIADNINTMLTSGISIVRAIEVTGNVVGNRVYEEIMHDVQSDVKGGSSLSDAFNKHEQIPQIMVQMIQVGEETGSLGSILQTMAKFYKREVDDAVDTLVGLIEPIMIVFLGLAVGVLLTSVLLPIYNIAGSL